MPKENTHLWFARSLLAVPVKADIPRCVQDKPLFFFLGAIIPDAFFYHYRSRVRRMARVLHGSDPEWHGAVPAHLARLAGQSGSMPDRAFMLGYLTHLALDQVFHPVIHVLSGRRIGQASSSESIARHRLVETALDRMVNHSSFYPRIIQTRSSDHVAILHALARDVGLVSTDVRRALTIQAIGNRLVMQRSVHTALQRANSLPWPNLSALLNLCYAQLDFEPAMSASGSQAGGSDDLETDRALRAARRIKWDRLFAQSQGIARRMFSACTAYWQGELSDSALEEALPRRACD